MYDELTEVDIKKMEEEIEYRSSVLGPQLLAEMKRTREFGDLSENADQFLFGFGQIQGIIPTSRTDDLIRLATYYDRRPVNVPVCHIGKCFGITFHKVVGVYPEIVSKSYKGGS